MATPSARFVIKFDSDTSGIDQSKSKLDNLKTSIENDTKALKEMGDAMTRLKGTAEVTRWEVLPKDIKAAENEVGKLSAKMAKLKADALVAPIGKVDGILATQGKTQEDLDKATKRLSALRDEQGKLSKSTPVKLFEDLKAGSEKLKQSLGKNQVEFSRLGGSMGETKGKLDQLAEGANAAGSPLGGMVDKFKQLKALGPAAVYVAIAIALVAVATGFALVIAKATAFAITMSDAYRSAGLLREASAVGSASAKDLEQSMLRVEEKTNAQRDAVAGLVNEYSRLRLSLASIEGATSAVTVATQTMGSAAGSTIKGLIDRGVDTKRFWLNALDLKGTGLALRDVSNQLAKQMGIAVGAAEAALRDGRVKLEDGIKALDAAVEARFGEVARRQMLALPVQLDRAKKNLSSLFSGVKIESFLEKLGSALELLNESNVVGKALKQVFTTIFQPFANAAGDTMPLLEGFILGVTLALQGLIIFGLKAAIVFKKMFGGSSFFKDLDMVKAGLYAGYAAVAVLVVGLGALAAVLAVVAIAFAIVLSPLILAATLIFAIGYAIGYVVDTISTAIDDLVQYLVDTGTSIEDAAEGITDGLIKAIEEALPNVAKAFASIAETGVKAFKSAFGIASPAKEIYKPAKWLVPGATKALREDEPKFANAIEQLSDSTISGDAVGGGIVARMADAAGKVVNVVVNYYGSGSREDAQQFGQWLREELETEKLARAR